MLDVLVMVDGYCHLLLQRVNLIEHEKECPDELKEAASSLIFAAPRCGEFPELQEIRAILTSRYGKEFANGATDLRSNCGVNTRMIQKLSPRQSTLETRMKILQEIATENGIVLQLEEPVMDEVVEVSSVSSGSSSRVENNSAVLADEVLSFSESRKGKKKFRDVEDAAQAAFESAAYAAAAARAAVELSRSGSFGSDNPDSPNSRPRKVGDSEKSKLNMRYEKNHESESESKHKVIKVENEGETSKNHTLDTDGSDSDGYNKPSEKGMVFDESDNEIENEHTGFSSLGNYDEGLNTEQGAYTSRKQFPISPKNAELGPGNAEPRFGGEGSTMAQLDLTKKPISVRNKRVYGR